MVANPSTSSCDWDAGSDLISLLRRLAFALAVAVGSAAAQARPTLTITVPTEAVVDGPTLRIERVFGDQRSRELLAAGFPARVSMEVELWATGRFTDERLRLVRTDWMVRYDAVGQVYRVARVVGDSLHPVGRHGTLAALVEALSAPVRVPLPAPSGRRGLYYSARLTVASLTNTDLAEVERWLRGDLGGALQGDRLPTSPVTRLVRTLMSRVLGGQVVRVETRSVRFTR